jgi:hypothetical protein
MSKSFWFEDEKQTGNFSNDKQDTFKEENRYVGVRLQQGVPLLDRSLVNFKVWIDKIRWKNEDYDSLQDERLGNTKNSQVGMYFS